MCGERVNNFLHCVAFVSKYIETCAGRVEPPLTDHSGIRTGTRKQTAVD